MLPDSRTEEGRKTFREKQNGEAWQYKIKEEMRERYKGKEWWSEADVDLRSAFVRPTSRKIAEKITLEYEWLGTLASNTESIYGIFFDGWACGGVCCFGRGANAQAHKEFDIKHDELSYLYRGACTHWTPKNTNSKLISYSLELEKKKGKKVAIAYADPDAGEIGQLYQATNWLFIGKTSTLKQFIHPETGRIYDQMIINVTLNTNRLKGIMKWKEMKKYFLEEGWGVQETSPKYKYAYILSEDEEYDRIYNRIKNNIKEYPKREDLDAKVV